MVMLKPTTSASVSKISKPGRKLPPRRAAMLTLTTEVEHIHRHDDDDDSQVGLHAVAPAPASEQETITIIDTMKRQINWQEWAKKKGLEKIKKWTANQSNGHKDLLNSN
jgi:hypothetical protein